MPTILPLLRLMAFGALALASACGGFTPPASKGTPAPTAPPAYGTLKVSLTMDGAAPEFSQLQLQLSGLAMEVGGVWTPVPLDAMKQAPGGTALPQASLPLDLVALASGSPEVLATGVPWPEGLNTRIRLLFAPGGSATPASDGQNHPLKAAAVLEAVMGLPGGFNVVAGTTTNMVLVVTLAHAVLPDAADPTTYVFQPLAVRGYDQAATGSIQGRLTASATEPGGDPVPLAGATVTAQLVEPLAAGGAGVVFRTAVTDASGQYALDLLPLGFTWCGVSLPLLGAQAYDAGAGTGIRLGYPPYDTGTSDLTVLPSVGAGAIAGVVAGTLPPGEVDVVDLVDTFAPEAEAFTVTLQSALVAGGQFSFSALPPGTYGAVLNRYTYVPGTGMTHQRTLATPFTVEGGRITPVAF